MEKTMYSISEIVKMGYPRSAVVAAVHGHYGNMVARRTSPRGKFVINLEKFKDYWNRGMFERAVEE